MKTSKAQRLQEEAYEEAKREGAAEVLEELLKAIKGFKERLVVDKRAERAIMRELPGMAKRGRKRKVSIPAEIVEKIDNGGGNVPNPELGGVRE